ncbi:hypothetical protein NPIL_331301 [Nephila pilipes]|uniref:Uncharacterized protein n=1 Tax=Nephila pilipes TaxID=299642 RepID=A0A8X6N0C7_NEPPI|nr:hypothetical protein NPIL_331301 [Nephila pilipes]
MQTAVSEVRKPSLQKHSIIFLNSSEPKNKHSAADHSCLHWKACFRHPFKISGSTVDLHSVQIREKGHFAAHAPVGQQRRLRHHVVDNVCP